VNQYGNPRRGYSKNDNECFHVTPYAGFSDIPHIGILFRKTPISIAGIGS
jgi:hypothetical protein